jgi:hypothetical protein
VLENLESWVVDLRPLPMLLRFSSILPCVLFCHLNNLLLVKNTSGPSKTWRISKSLWYCKVWCNHYTGVI